MQPGITSQDNSEQRAISLDGLIAGKLDCVATEATRGQ
jgi:hypothetical protein